MKLPCSKPSKHGKKLKKRKEKHMNIYHFFLSISPSPKVSKKKQIYKNTKVSFFLILLIPRETAYCVAIGIATIIAIVVAAIDDGGDGGGEHSWEIRVSGDGCGGSADCVSQRRLAWLHRPSGRLVVG